MSEAITTEAQSSTAATSEATATAGSRSLARDAWYDLRRSVIFWVSLAIITALIVIAVAPGLFTDADPHLCRLSHRFGGAEGDAPFGYDGQGCNVYAKTIYGARYSLIVGVVATSIAGTIAIVFGTVAGYFGRWVDALLSRTLDILLSIPFLLASIVLLKRLSANTSGSRLWPVVFALGVLTWTTAARVARSSVISAKQQDYVQAARMLGAGNLRIMVRHILPNSLAPVVVVLTITLGLNISTEAVLSYLGIGLQAPAVSWGQMINDASSTVRTAAAPLLWPSGFLAATVLAFIMLGDAVRDAFDPRMR